MPTFGIVHRQLQTEIYLKTQCPNRSLHRLSFWFSIHILDAAIIFSLAFACDFLLAKSIFGIKFIRTCGSRHCVCVMYVLSSRSLNRSHIQRERHAHAHSICKLNFIGKIAFAHLFYLCRPLDPVGSWPGSPAQRYHMDRISNNLFAG